MPGVGQVAQVKITIMVPVALVRRIETKIRRDGSATCVADYLRQAAAHELVRDVSALP